ncbi:hypothetical protein KP509_30G056500 [Ceratopteris richardii]|uniref:Uncharacterized protein n=1 Tax=Ceratopteris richardii TaxID=49495 RepID=A0A8T2R468_CERRI|nr:hypothetical protein KP509_30G056500 [Ceratopteris richardii]
MLSPSSALAQPCTCWAFILAHLLYESPRVAEWLHLGCLWSPLAHLLPCQRASSKVPAPDPWQCFPYVFSKISWSTGCLQPHIIVSPSQKEIGLKNVTKERLETQHYLLEE